MDRQASLVPLVRERYRKLKQAQAYSLLLKPRVLLNFVRHAREVERRPIVIHTRPSSVEIELTNRCNLACIQCLRSQGLKPYELGDVTFSDYQRMLAQFPDIRALVLNGFGEPLMHPEFLDLVAYAHKTLPWAKITIYSNGMLLTEELAQRLPGSGLSEINVSIDAAKPETYRRVRRGGELEVVHENIRGLLRARKAAGKKYPLVGVNYVMLNENEGELVPFIEQAAELGVDFINCVTYATYDWGFVNRRTPESYRAELAAARARLDELKLQCRTLPSDDLSWADPARPFDCDFFWGSALRVTYDGHVTLGCCTPFKETFSYGNILETPFAELWNGPTYRRHRELARRHEAPEPSCAECAKQVRGFFGNREPELVQLRPRKGHRQAKGKVPAE